MLPYFGVTPTAAMTGPVIDHQLTRRRSQSRVNRKQLSAIGPKELDLSDLPVAGARSAQ